MIQELLGLLEILNFTPLHLVTEGVWKKILFSNIAPGIRKIIFLDTEVKRKKKGGETFLTGYSSSEAQRGIGEGG